MESWVKGRRIKMNKEQLKGKRFLEDLLKYATEIGEKTAELAYWRADGLAENSDSEDISAREQELELLIQSLTKKKLDATRMIDKMEDPVARAVLRRRYILCDTWARIADSCGGMSERNAHYIHDMALLDFEKIYTSG
jgi:hypothetical protein